jgi:hypothetical protein
MGIHFEKKHQKRIKELGQLINEFQTYSKENSFESLTIKERTKLRDISYELIEISNHYEIKRKYANQDRRINYETKKIIEGTKND